MTNDSKKSLRQYAKIYSQNHRLQLQKLARQQGKAVITATTHSDLQEDIKPSVLVRKRFGEEINIIYYPNTPVEHCSLLKETTIEKGTVDDWNILKGFHYRSHQTTARRAIFAIKLHRERCEVI
jgi:hypothetical protein